MTYQHTKITKSIELITLTPPLPGFDNFICVWLVRGEENFIVDPGPAVTSTTLLKALKDINFPRPDYILLTHIHLDHAGSIGEISAAFPEAPVVCHPLGLPHLENPEKLWAGTIKTLGETGRTYGEIKPVARRRLLDVNDFTDATIKSIITPGHAPHHVSFLTSEKVLLAGETGGVSLTLPSGQNYLRPATPPRFDLEIASSSLDKLIEENPDIICYGHAQWRNNAVDLLQQHQKQLLLWEAVISQEMESGSAGDDLIEQCRTKLFQEDTLLSALNSASPGVIEREQFFIKNSIKGFVGYLQNKPTETGTKNK